MIILVILGFAAIWFGTSIANGARNEADGNGGILMVAIGVVMLIAACVVSLI